VSLIWERLQMRVQVITCERLTVTCFAPLSQPRENQEFASCMPDLPPVNLSGSGEQGHCDREKRSWADCSLVT
jgi:hypothetical protein